jgi:hypothetical protein
MQVSYTKGWFRANKHALAIWDKKKAEKLHNDIKAYAVILGDPDKPAAYLEIKLNIHFVIVNFFDEELRDYLEYRFKEMEPGKLFLMQSIQRTYKENSSKVIRAQTCRFEPDGRLTIKNTNLETGEESTKEATEKIDTSKHWEAVPDFGEYTSLARIER